MSTPLMRRFLPLLVLIVAACGGGGDGGIAPGPTPAAGGFSLSTTGTQIAQASSGTANITVNRTGSFTGDVSLSVEGAPVGVTATLSPATIPSGSIAATLQLQVALSVPAGSYPLTIRGQGTGVSAQTATVNLSVVTRPASVTLTRATTAALTTSAGGLPISFGLVLNRVEFLGEVTVAVASGLPTGVTANVTPSATTNNAVTVALTVAANAAPGNYTAVLRATAAGISAITLDVPFTVTGAASVAIGLSRTSVSLPPNGSDNTSVTLTRTNYAGAVTLAVTGAPTGVTATFGSNPVATNGTGLAFTAGPTAVPGAYPITVAASAPGVTGSAIGLTLVVTAIGVGGNTAIRFCGTAADVPIWLGVQDGNSWIRVTEGANRTFTFDLPTLGTLAWVTQAAVDDFRVAVTSGTRAELAVIVAGQCVSPSGRTATGTVAGLGAAEQAQVVLGPRAPGTTPTFASPGFSITGLPDGPLDLLASRASLDVGLAAFIVNRVIVQRGVNPANGGSVGTLDFAAGSALTPELKTLTVQGAAIGEQLLGSASFVTAGGTALSLGSALITAGNSTTFRHVPLASLLAGDFHQLLVSATQTTSGQTISRSATQLVAIPDHTTIALGAPPGEPTVSVFATNAERLRFNTNIPLQAEYNRLYTASWSQQAGATRRAMILTTTQAAATEVNGNAIRMRAPDFTAAPGWNPLWESRSGLTATWLVSASGWAASGGFAGQLADGVVTKSYVRTGTITP